MFMKIFIAGPRALRTLDEKIIRQLNSISAKEHEVIVGDADGIDTAVQQFFADRQYENVIIYATEGKARNNVGRWKIKSVVPPSQAKGFRYYAAKDLEMAKDADFGFMIWNGKSKGTLNNILNLIALGKKCKVYLSTVNELYAVKSLDDIKCLVSLCEEDTQMLFQKLLKENEQIKIFLREDYRQLAINII